MQLTVALLGEPHARSGDVVVACSSRKALGLFCQVALSLKTQSRAELAQMFWGRADPEAARASLRTALLRLPKPLAGALRVDRHSVSLADGVELDTKRFVRLSASQEAEALTEAAQLYRGELLKGLEVDATPEFDDWLARERSRYRLLAQSVFDRLIEHHRRRAGHDAAHAAVEREAAMATARRWCELEPAAESAHRWLIRLYLDAGRGDAALEQFEICKRELAVALGRSPGPETRAIVEAIASSAAVPSRLAVEDGARVPMHGQPGTTFLGRADDLASLERLLFEPQCRLITIQGLGGMGKSRLAATLMDQAASRFAQGAAWIPLESTRTASELPTVIARALRIELAPRVEPLEALCAALAKQDRLLVLDNFEQQLAPANDTQGDAAEDVLLRLLGAAPRVRLVVTSRAVLGLQEEWIYELKGLSFPASDGAEHVSERHAAIELFTQRARQAYMGFSPQAEWPHMVALTRLVEGLPLAIELAAAWVRTIPCGDLVATIQAEARSIATRHRNRPDRHASLEAVVETSWSLLDAEQQKALASLSVFVDGFTQEAGGVVGGSTLRVLSSLVDKSLVQRRPSGRLSIHELVRQFAHAKLNQHGADYRLASRRHSTYFASWLVRQREQLDRLGSIDAYDAVSAEWGNLKAAAPAWSLNNEGAGTSEAWARVLSARGDFAAVRNYVNGVLNQEGVLPDETQCRLLAYRGVANNVLGPSEAARADLMASIEKSRERNLIEPLAFALTQLAMTAAVSEDSNWMEARLAEIAAVLPQVRDVSTSVRARYLEGNWLLMQGRTTEALQSYEHTIAFGVQHEASELQLAAIKVSTANALILLGDHARAESLLQEAVTVFERAGSLVYVCRALNSLALAIVWQGATGRLPLAIQLARRALTIADEIGYQNGSWGISDTLGQALWASGDRDEARRHFETASQSPIPSARHDAQVHLGLLQLERGETADARRIALDRLDAALASTSHLQILRAASLLAISVILDRDAEDRRAIAWLESLLSQSDLEIEHRRRAQVLWQSVTGSAAVGIKQTSQIDAGALTQMREAVAALGEA